MSIRNFFGLAVILITVSGILGFGYLQGQNKELVSGDLTTESQEETVPVEELTLVEGYLGWEKKGFFQDEEVQAILASEYGLDVGISKKGSIEMVTEPTNGQDYLFPSNRIATELYRSRTGTGSETIFFSPIVVYTWDSLVDDLQNTGLVEVRDGIHYIDTNKLVTSIEAGTTWQEAGGRQLQGPIKVRSTNPAKSSSGNLFSALVFSTMTEQYPPSTRNVTPETTERLQEFFRNMGLLESSSSDLFEKFLTLGRSSYPLTVGYESQLIELLNAETPGGGPDCTALSRTDGVGRARLHRSQRRGPGFGRSPGEQRATRGDCLGEIRTPPHRSVHGYRPLRKQRHRSRTWTGFGSTEGGSYGSYHGRTVAFSKFFTRTYFGA